MPNEEGRLTEEESTLFEALTSGLYSNFALMSGHFDGKKVVIIVSVTEGKGDEVSLSPLAILVDADDDEMMDRLTDMDDRPTEDREAVDGEGGQ